MEVSILQIDGTEIDFTKQRGYFFNMDCMKALKQMPDKSVSLAICDPPYGIKRLKNPKGRLEKYGDTTQANNDVPTKDYFNELFRVSKNQVIWGGAITLKCHLVDVSLHGISISL